MQRKSSRGNPWHDERGRFTSGPKGIYTNENNDGSVYAQFFNDKDCTDEYDNHEFSAEEIAEHGGLNGAMDWYLGAKKSEKSPKEYEEQTLHRAEKQKELERYEKDKDASKAETYVVNEDGTYELTTSKELQEGMIVEYAPEWCSPGEEKYVHVVKEFRANPATGDPNGRVLISTINTQSSLGSTQVVDREMIQPASKEKVESLSEPQKMPWESDPHYKNMKNPKLQWLMDNPQSKYNNPSFLSGIKRIENMADMGLSADARKASAKRLAESHGMTEDEVMNFIGREFVE